MRYKIDHDYHIHSQLSLCSQHPEQTPARILKYAEERGLKKIVLTDHFWDDNAPGMPDKYRDREYDPYGERPKLADRGESTARWYRMQNFAHISRSLPLPKSDKVEFLFGAETEMQHDFSIGITREMIDRLGFVIIPTTHMHMERLTLTEEQMASAEGRAKAWIDRIDALLDKDLPFGKIGIAHLACDLIAKPRENFLRVMQLLDQSEMERVFAKAAKVGVGIEINQYDFDVTEEELEIISRPFKIAKAQGCKFYLGSDAHSPDGFDTTERLFTRAIDTLGLTENDKFYLHD
jgi:histidinol phosphatase-like PHP family hydrolase